MSISPQELGEDSSSREGFHIADIEEIPRGSLDIDLSPIRPQISACDDPMETKHSSAACEWTSSDQLLLDSH